MRLYVGLDRRAVKGGIMGSKAEQTKDKIFKTAFELFERDGYRQTTIPAICEAAGVSRSTFFHYFKSKDSLLSNYRFRFADNLEKIAETLPSDLSGKEKVRMLLLADAEQCLERASMLRQAIISSYDKDPEFRASHDRTFEKVPPIYTRILKESNPDASVEYCARVGLLITRMYWMIWNSCIIMRDPYDFKQELSDSLDLMWDGFKLS